MANMSEVDKHDNCCKDQAQVIRRFEEFLRKFTSFWTREDARKVFDEWFRNKSKLLEVSHFDSAIHLTPNPKSNSMNNSSFVSAKENIFHDEFFVAETQFSPTQRENDQSFEPIQEESNSTIFSLDEELKIIDSKVKTGDIRNNNDEKSVHPSKISVNRLASTSSDAENNNNSNNITAEKDISFGSEDPGTDDFFMGESQAVVTSSVIINLQQTSVSVNNDTNNERCDMIQNAESKIKSPETTENVSVRNSTRLSCDRSITPDIDFDLSGDDTRLFQKSVLPQSNSNSSDCDLFASCTQMMPAPIDGIYAQQTQLMPVHDERKNVFTADTQAMPELDSESDDSFFGQATQAYPIQTKAQVNIYAADTQAMPEENNRNNSFFAALTQAMPEPNNDENIFAAPTQVAPTTNDHKHDIFLAETQQLPSDNGNGKIFEMSTQISTFELTQQENLRATPTDSVVRNILKADLELRANENQKKNKEKRTKMRWLFDFSSDEDDDFDIAKPTNDKNGNDKTVKTAGKIEKPKAAKEEMERARIVEQCSSYGTNLRVLIEPIDVTKYKLTNVSTKSNSVKLKEISKRMTTRSHSTAAPSKNVEKRSRCSAASSNESDVEYQSDDSNSSSKMQKIGTSGQKNAVVSTSRRQLRSRSTTDRPSNDAGKNVVNPRKQGMTTKSISSRPARRAAMAARDHLVDSPF